MRTKVVDTRHALTDRGVQDKAKNFLLGLTFPNGRSVFPGLFGAGQKVTWAYTKRTEILVPQKRTSTPQNPPVRLGDQRSQPVQPSTQARNPHEVLGVPKGASEAEIRKAYLNSARIHHPDKGGDAEAFKELRNAYEALGG